MIADAALSQREFDILWSTMASVEPPFPLRTSVHSMTIPEWARTREDACVDLRSQGVLTLAAERLLGLLVKPSRLVDLFSDVDGPLHSVASTDEKDAVLVTAVNERIALTRIRPITLVEAMVSQLPDVAAGSGKSIAVRHADVLRATSDQDDPDNPLGDDTELDALVRAEISSPDAARIVEIAGNRIGEGQIGVSVADRVGRLHRPSVLTTWSDPDFGRYLRVWDAAWMSIMPADNQRIVHQIRNILDSEVN